MTRRVRIEPAVLEGVRVTIPARETLAAAGNVLCPAPAPAGSSHALWFVTLARPPAGLVRVLIGQGDAQHHGLRLAIEPPFPGEWSQPDAVSWWERGALVPCPRCGAGLIWFEAGYVPGYRICCGPHQHHAQLAADGRTAVPAGLRGGVG